MGPWLETEGGEGRGIEAYCVTGIWSELWEGCCGGFWGNRGRLTRIMEGAEYHGGL